MNLVGVKASKYGVISAATRTPKFYVENPLNVRSKTTGPESSQNLPLSTNNGYNESSLDNTRGTSYNPQEFNNSWHTKIIVRATQQLFIHNSLKKKILGIHYKNKQGKISPKPPLFKHCFSQMDHRISILTVTFEEQ